MRYNKTVWLTEFSCGEAITLTITLADALIRSAAVFPHALTSPDDVEASSASQLAFQQEVLPIMDRMSSNVLQRYAWFAARTYQNAEQQHATLLNEAGDQNLTSLGENFNSTCDAH